MHEGKSARASGGARVASRSGRLFRPHTGTSVSLYARETHADIMYAGATVVLHPTRSRPASRRRIRAPVPALALAPAGTHVPSRAILGHVRPVQSPSKCPASAASRSCRSAAQTLPQAVRGNLPARLAGRSAASVWAAVFTHARQCVTKVPVRRVLLGRRRVATVVKKSTSWDAARALRGYQSSFWKTAPRSVGSDVSNVITNVTGTYCCFTHLGH